MHRSPCALLLAVSVSGVVFASCAEITDETGLEGRPYDLPYLTTQIFAPSCGQTQCHSTFKRAADLVFDHPAAVRESLVRPSPDALLQFTSERYDPRRIDGTVPNLIRWITEIDPFGVGVGRMPFDMPLAEMDVRLLEVWISEPRDVTDPETGRTAKVGAAAAGAQCNPNLFDGFACNFDRKVSCGADWNFEPGGEACSAGCSYDFNRMVIQCAP